MYDNCSGICWTRDANGGEDEHFARSTGSSCGRQPDKHGWKIAPTGGTVAQELGCCCPLGALALAAGYAWHEEPDNYDEVNAGLNAIDLLGEGSAFGNDFMRGFDGPEYAEAAGLPENMLAYNYGKSFRTLYETL